MTDISSAVHPSGLLWLGLLLGIRHAADADRVAAIGAIAARTRQSWPAGQLASRSDPRRRPPMARR